MPALGVNLPPEELARSLLDKGLVGGVMGLRRLGNGAFMSLITSSNHLDGLCPLFPLMPSNGGRNVSRLTLEGPVNTPVAVFLRPCELRALVELVKLNQAHLDNLFLIGIECNGVVPNREVFVQQRGEELYSGYLEACKNGEPFEPVREVCKGCEHPYPEGADLVVSVIGRPSPVVVALSERGEDLLKELGLELTETEPRTEASIKLQERRLAEYRGLEVKGIDGLLEVFGRCIGCHNCSHVCPICYCKDCFFESATFDYEPESYENRLNKRGTFRMPLDTVLFHLGRMTHMSTSCVACGMCEDACPMEIPVARVFKLVGKSTQELFEYVPGRSVDEELPLTTFRYQELQEVEDR